MSTITMHATTSATPEQYTAGLTDFGPGRSKVFGNSANSYLKVHEQGPTSADVTEGSGGVWERLSYDSSDPNHVVARTTDSNASGGKSGHTYTYTRDADGTTNIDQHRLCRGAGRQELQGPLPRLRARERRQEPARRGLTALALGPVAWVAGYVVLPLAKVHQPIWDDDARTRGAHLSAHLVYGSATSAAFGALASLERS